MRIIEHLQNYSLRDLLIYLIFKIRGELDRLFSTSIFYLKCILLGVNIKSGAKVWGGIYLNRFPSSQIFIGSNVTIISSSYLYGLNIFSKSKIRTFSSTAVVTIGDNVAFNSLCILARSKEISIGSGTLIGGNCQVMDTDSHPIWPPQARRVYPGSEFDESVSIGRDVFIGLNVIILKGTIIGDNSVIAAGSIVRGTIPANCLAAGVPAKVVKYFCS